MSHLGLNLNIKSTSMARAVDCGILTFKRSYYASVMIYDNATMAASVETYTCNSEETTYIRLWDQTPNVTCNFVPVSWGFPVSCAIRIFVYGFINENNNKFIN